MDEFQNRLNIAMEKKKWSQADLLRYIEMKHKDSAISKSSLSMYVSGKRKPNMFSTEILADSLGVTVPWLLGYVDGDENFKIGRYEFNSKGDMIGETKESDDEPVVDKEEPSIRIKEMELILEYSSKLASLSREKRQLVFSMIDNLVK